MSAYYNEFDPRAAAWLRQLIKNGLIADGEVDERSITEVKASDIRGFRRQHFFAGIAGWERALQLAGWDDDRSVCTASLPCQPFSVAGAGKGKSDERHLLPHFIELVKQCNFPIIFGEQVSAAIRLPRLRVEIENLQSLQNRQAYLRILSIWEREGYKNLQSMQSIIQGEKTIKKGDIFRRIQGLEIEKQGKGFSKCGVESCERARDGVGYNGGMGTRDNRQGDMRSNWDSIRFGNTESLERAITGQDSQQYRVSEIEHENCYLCSECDDEYMGRAEDIGNINWNNESAETEISKSIGQISREFEESNQSSWIDDLQSAMEEEGYTFGASVLGAHSAGAPHIRQRLYWVANSHGVRRISRREGSKQETMECAGVGNDAGENLEQSSGVCGLSDLSSQRHERRQDSAGEKRRIGLESACGEWSDSEWLYCRDGKYRPTKPGIKPLVDGIPRGMVRSGASCESIDANNTQEARAMRLKGYGNAIVPAVAASFIRAFMGAA